MRSINDYNEYLAPLKETTSKDPVAREEAKKALEILQKEAPDRYTLYRMLNKDMCGLERILKNRLTLAVI